MSSSHACGEQETLQGLDNHGLHENLESQVCKYQFNMPRESRDYKKGKEINTSLQGLIRKRKQHRNSIFLKKSLSMKGI